MMRTVAFVVAVVLGLALGGLAAAVDIWFLVGYPIVWALLAMSFARPRSRPVTRDRIVEQERF